MASFPVATETGPMLEILGFQQTEGTTTKSAFHGTRYYFPVLIGRPDWKQRVALPAVKLITKTLGFTCSYLRDCIIVILGIPGPSHENLALLIECSVSPDEPPVGLSGSVLQMIARPRTSPANVKGSHRNSMESDWGRR